MNFASPKETTGGISYNQIRKEATPPLLPAGQIARFFHATTKEVFLKMEDKTPDKAPEGKTAPVVPGTPKPEQTGPEPVPGTSAPSLGQDKAGPTGQEAPTKATPDKAAPGKVIPIQGGKPTPGKDGPAKGDKFAPAKAGPAKGDKPFPGKGDPAKGDKPAPAKGKKGRDKLSQGDKDKAQPKAKGPGAPDDKAPAEPPKEPETPPRPVEQGKLVYLKLSETHAFHTYRKHPYRVRDDAKMRETLESVKVKGVLTPGIARPEKDGNGYEIISGHRRHRASELAGLEDMPFIVREMTDHQAVEEMKIANDQRDEILPTELAALLDLEVEDIKHQGGRLDGVAEGDKGKRSVKIVGESHGMNYKKVMRYIRLNHLIDEFKDLVDGVGIGEKRKMGFMPAVELSYLTKKHQQMVLVSMEGEQVFPSLSQAQTLRKLEKEGKLTGDVIDGILSQEKKEVDRVIISTEELNKYFGESATPRQMKDQIIALLDEWKAKQPPEKSKPPKTAERD